MVTCDARDHCNLFPAQNAPIPITCSTLSVLNSDHCDFWPYSGETWSKNGESLPYLSSLHPNEALKLKHMRPEIPSVRRHPKSTNKKTNFWIGKFLPKLPEKKPF
jgi:hypothetical protein